ncbi:Esterase EstB [Aquisphaera giovannonii]|uniref:Esterase EstB n=1 Tax=Aquisphaera giovannonii TaxID=406548 RepID=A0A5B9W2W9_9BACT|nr:serine hydrolase domain-containing protein [Aquisphaera giovannonii]QEH34589.1 Esterase EstB [Aquisphaera giovannonii]
MCDASRASRRIVTLSMAVAVISLASARGAGAQESAPASKTIAAAVRPYVERHALAGAVTLVADKDRVLSVDAVGYADISGGKPMKADALFWIASQSKPITATAFMMLVDEGKVKLDDPVAKYLPEFRQLWVAAEKDDSHILLTRPAHPITIREILSHTSGLPFASAAEQPTLDLLPLRVGALTYAMTPLQSQPGTRYSYSNAGINTAGRIIEVVSGMPYEEFLAKRLFEPLGMRDTTFRPSGPQLDRLAKPYKPDAAKTGLEETTVTQLRYPLDDPKRQPMPAGGLFSTAHDLSRFCRMVLNGGELDGRRYLSRGSVAAMTTKQTPEPLKEGYGLGWSTDGKTFGHGGAYATNMTIGTRTGLITIWLVQHAGFPGDGEKSQGAFQQAAEKEFGTRP